MRNFAICRAARSPTPTPLYSENPTRVSEQGQKHQFVPKSASGENPRKQASVKSADHSCPDKSAKDSIVLPVSDFIVAWGKVFHFARAWPPTVCEAKEESGCMGRNMSQIATGLNTNSTHVTYTRACQHLDARSQLSRADLDHFKQ